MTRHKKFLKSEKSKTKLKGAKLPKGLNVTKTEFKIRKIVIRDQIKEPTIVDGAIVRSNIKDLLSKLQHHNSTNRNEGLHFLKEIITNHPQETSKHLGAIIQGICQLALDLEKDVRKECFKALSLVFASQTSDLISPFFNVITSYLRCAMTHINTQIQEDSLLLLDCLLLYTPSLVASNSDSIFSCFLDMISKLRTESKPERTLTTNLGRKLSSVKWRSKVLDRLLGILRAIVEHRKFTQTQIHLDEPNSTAVNDAFKLPSEQSITSARYQVTQFSFDENVDSFFPVARKHLNRNCDLPLLFRKTSGTITANASNLLAEHDEGEKLKKYVELLMPLLFETWMEVRPAKLNLVKITNDFIDEDVCISNEAAFTLKITIEIIEQLLELIYMYDQDFNNDDLIKWFRMKYCAEFSNQFLNGFPYHQIDGFKGSKRKAKGMATEQEVYEAGGQKCIQQNLNIAFIFWALNKNSTNSQILANTIIEYITECLVSLNSYGPDNLQIFVKLLRTILVDIAQEWLNTTPSIKELLTTVLNFYQYGKLPKEIRTRILIILCDIVLDHKLYSAYGQTIFSNWLSTLPKLLCQSHISSHVLKTFSHLARQKNMIFMKQLALNQEAIMVNLRKVQINGLDNQLQGKQEIINLFYWLDSWKPDQNEALKLHLESEWKIIEKLYQIKSFY